MHEIKECKLRFGLLHTAGSYMKSYDISTPASNDNTVLYSVAMAHRLRFIDVWYLKQEQLLDRA